jgi:transcriptional regulator with XRE-family HTH domain
MRASLRQHNLFRLREELNLTQGELAKLIGRSEITIRAIETGHLALSPRLAEIIAGRTGVNRDWLLRNDLYEPMPPLMHVSATLDPGDAAYELSCELFKDLFERLFLALSRLKKTEARALLEELLQTWVDNLKILDEPLYDQADPAGPHVFEFFKCHPEFLDLDLAGWINLDYLLEDAYRVRLGGYALPDGPPPGRAAEL